MTDRTPRPTRTPIADPAAFSIRLASAARAFPAALEAEVARRWAAARAARPALFDGAVLSAIEVGPRGIVAAVVAYRYLHAQLAAPALAVDLGVRPVAVSGLLECADGVVFGRRAGHVTQDPGRWELVPSGGVEPGDAGPGEPVDFLGQLYTELDEELGLSRAAIATARPFCLVESADTGVVDIGIRLDTALDSAAIARAFAGARTREYDALRVVPRALVDAVIGTARAEYVGVSLALLGAHD